MDGIGGTRQEEAPATGVRGLMNWTYEHRRRFATVGAAVLSIVFGYHVIFGQNGLTAYEHKRHEVRMLNQRLMDLTDENERLRGHVERLQDDPGAIEAAARDELHYTRPGEVIVTLPNEKPAGSVSADSK